MLLPEEISLSLSLLTLPQEELISRMFLMLSTMTFLATSTTTSTELEEQEDAGIRELQFLLSTKIVESLRTSSNSSKNQNNLSLIGLWKWEERTNHTDTTKIILIRRSLLETTITELMVLIKEDPTLGTQKPTMLMYLQITSKKEKTLEERMTDMDKIRCLLTQLGVTTETNPLTIMDMDQVMEDLISLEEAIRNENIYKYKQINVII